MVVQPGFEHVALLSPPIAPPHRRRYPRAAPFAVLGLAAIMAAGCQNVSVLNSLSQGGPVSAPTPAKTDVDWRHEAEGLGAKYRAEPGDPDVALAYAQALRA